jgi:hypothetical protein
MNNKAKLLLGLTSILAVSGAVAATSTFAWFTTQRTATVNFTSATVYNTMGKLKIAYSGETNGGCDSGTVSGTNVLDVVGTTNAKITDISGNGKTFYRPDWLPGQENIAASGFSTKTNDGVDYYYIRFGMTLSNEGNAPMTVYLNKGCSITGKANSNTAQKAKNDLAAKATRVSFYESDTLRSIWQYDNTDGTANTNYKYVTTDSTATGATQAYGVAGYYTANPVAATFHIGDFDSVSSGFTAGNGQMLCTLAKSGETGAQKTITVTIWLEGTSKSATNTTTADAVGGIVNMNVALAAV